MSAPTGITHEIVPEQIAAVGTIYLAWHLDVVHAFDAADRVVELATRGKLKLGSGDAAAALAGYAFDPDRLSDAERWQLYARTFGARTAAAFVGEINPEFEALWQRFVAAVAESARAPGPAAPLLARWTVRHAARDLAVNLSRHGAERALEEARALHRSLEQLLHLLQARELLDALGAASMWDVIERVDREHLGIAVDIVRARALAQSGSHVIGWLAAHAADVAGLGAGTPSAAADADLIATVERWIAASATDADAPAPRAPSPSAPPRLQRLPTLPADAMPALERIEHDARARPGVCALFHGAAESAKVLAGQMLASRLARPLARVDAVAIVSKYAGETEKNLDRVLAQAREAGAVLLLDDADALFGPRAGVQAADDPLRRIEAHPGLVLVSVSAAGEALARRLHYAIEFAQSTLLQEAGGTPG